MTILSRLQGLLLSIGYHLSAAILLPYTVWSFVVEVGSFSRWPVAAGITSLFVLVVLLHFSGPAKFRLRVSILSATVVVALFFLLGLAFSAVLSIIVVSYLCAAFGLLWRRRYGRPLVVSRNVGTLLVVAVLFVIYPWLNAMYFRGTGESYFGMDHKRENPFYEVNTEGYRGPLVEIARGPGPRLLFMGDSTTFGFPYRVEESYPHLVQRNLQSMGVANIEVINGGTMGHTLGNIRHSLRFYLQYQPDIVFVMAGFHFPRAHDDWERLSRNDNDRDTQFRPTFGVPMVYELLAWSLMTSWVAERFREHGMGPTESYGLPEFFERDRKAFVELLGQTIEEAKRQQVTLVFLDYPTPNVDRRILDEIRRVCGEMSVRFIPLFDEIGKEIKTVVGDGVHPDRAGHRMIAAAVTSVAFELLESR